MTEPINLKERFGKRYKITFDPAYDPKGRPRDTLDPWMMQISCRYGIIYPDGGGWVRIDVDNHPVITGQLAWLSSCELVMDGDHEKTFRFHIDDFAAVAAIVKPKQKRIVSPEQRNRLVEQLRPFRFQKRQPRKPEQRIDARTPLDAST